MTIPRLVSCRPASAALIPCLLLVGCCGEPFTFCNTRALWEWVGPDSFEQQDAILVGDTIFLHQLAGDDWYWSRFDLVDDWQEVLESPGGRDRPRIVRSAAALDSAPRWDPGAAESAQSNGSVRGSHIYFEEGRLLLAAGPSMPGVPLGVSVSRFSSAKAIAAVPASPFAVVVDLAIDATLAVATGFLVLAALFRM